MVKVFYNGIDVFSGLAPTPFVGVEDEFINYRDRFGAIKNITLQGSLTGKCKDMNYLVSAQNTLLNRFGTDYKIFEIKENNIPVYSYNYVKVNSISFEESKYMELLPFTINLSVYPNNLFTGIYGIIEPKNNITYTESQDGTISVKRNVSAKGINTNSTVNNALSNAISYVQSITGSNMITPAFIVSPLTTLLPRNISETVNRMDGTYSVDIDYIYRTNATASTVLSYTVDINYDEEKGIYNVSFKGNITAPIGYLFSNLRSEFQSLKESIFSLTFAKFTEVTNEQYLNSLPLNFNISENELDNSIEFSYSYDNDPYITKFDYSPSFTYDYTKDLYEVTIDGKLTTRGSQSEKNAILENALSQINIDTLAQNFYNTNTNISLSAPLNLNKKSFQIKRNKTQPEISVSATYDNTPIPPSSLKTFKYSISVDRSFYIHNPIQFLNGDNGAFKLNFYKRGSISIKGSATATNANLTNTVRSHALSLLNLHASYIGAKNRIRTEDNVTQSLQSNEQGFQYSFELTDTCETNIIN